MNEKTLAALKDSIEHWRRLATGTEKDGETPYGSHCALCDLFNFNPSPISKLYCTGCPVMEKTGKALCQGTPWHGAVNTWIKWKDWSEPHANFLAAAQKELEFLESLLPEKDANHG